MTKKKKILLISSIAAALAVLAVVGIVIYCLSDTSEQFYTNKDFGIDTFHSSVDMDDDGVDDQSDILSGAFEYVATKPVYKSVYYQGGYPTDEYGVCTDVVAQALLAAGYDLQALVDADRRNNPSGYQEGEEIDPNIDFRRVRNLLVFFQHNAISLTIDPREINQWQGGDIVVFEGHIGIVSDRRNKKGVTYVIHHGRVDQTEYEEDILENHGKILGHFRVSW